MPNFLIIYRSAVSPAEMFATATPERHRSFVRAWRAWSEAAGGALVDPGTLAQAVTDPRAGGDAITGYAIVTADDHESIELLLRSHPYLGNGGSAGVYQLLAT
ncbi:hypothetical protein ACWEVD_28580 [Nocardia thailandica]